jgi:hypothetical protein
MVSSLPTLQQRNFRNYARYCFLFPYEARLDKDGILMFTTITPLVVVNIQD